MSSVGVTRGEIVLVSTFALWLSYQTASRAGELQEDVLGQLAV